MKLFEKIKNGGVTSAEGFNAAGVTAGLKKSGKPDMALIYSEKKAVVAGTFTECVFKAAPVRLCIDKIKKGAGASAVIVNSGNANACTGSQGMDDARETCFAVSKLLNISEDTVYPASTGRIGVRMPMDKIRKGVEKAVKALSPEGGARAAAAVMTTDTVPKEAAVEFSIDNRKVTVGGMVKGAGMIAPKMSAPHATMLAFITTDASIDKELLSEMLSDSVDKSFNRITVDGDMSTNDTVLVLANGMSGIEINAGSIAAKRFKASMDYVAGELAKKIVRDAEGATKFVTVNVVNAATEEDASKCAGAIAGSLLCKTAWFGCDPNWGRVMAAAGYSGAVFDPDKAAMYYNGVPVVVNGMDAGTPEKDLALILRKNSEFELTVDLRAGNASWKVWTNDISYDYVKINAEYHT